LKEHALLGENMQPAPVASAWPKRILITGIALALIGLISLTMIMSSLGDYYDPRETSEHSVEIGDTRGPIELSSGCWVVNIEDSAKDYTITYQLIENGEEAGEVDEGCKTDFQAQTADVDFATVTELDIKEKSKVLVKISCESDDGCENPVLFTNGDAVIGSMITDPGLLITAGLCCVGFIFVPLGWLLISINRGHANKVHISQNQIVSAMQPLENEAQPENEILTTDQLYKLVRGEVPEAREQVSNVPSPFANVDTRVQKPAPSKEGGSINKASTFTPENPPTDDSWKNWDDA